MYKPSHTVDIIMPNFNKGKFISEAVSSVLNQTYKNWRLYIVDDYSHDNSKKILLKFKANKKIKIFFLKKNKGPSFCRNFAIKKSKSPFVAFLDSDDTWTKDKLKKQLDFMIKNKFNFTFTDYIPIFEDNGKKIKLKKTNLQNTLDYNKFLKDSSINTSTMIIQRKYLDGVKFRKLSLMEDYIFKCDLMKKTKIPFKKFPKSTAIYRIIKKSRSSKKINNFFNLWILNKKYNKLNFFNNLKSIFSISINSLKKYGLK